MRLGASSPQQAVGQAERYRRLESMRTVGDDEDPVLIEYLVLLGAMVETEKILGGKKHLTVEHDTHVVRGKALGCLDQGSENRMSDAEMGSDTAVDLSLFVHETAAAHETVAAQDKAAVQNKIAA